MNTPHPFPYQGSKRALADFIMRFIPARSGRLIEPFAGSAAVSLAAAHRRQAETFLLNDLNAPLIDLWTEIVDRPDLLAQAYYQLWQAQTGREREYYDHVRDEFNKTHRPDYLLYLLARCVKAAVRYNSRGEFNQGPDNRRSGMRPERMRHNLILTSQLLIGRTALKATDYREILVEATQADLVYMDPPYQGVSAKRDQRYVDVVTYDDFAAALDRLNTRGISYIVSYDGRTGDKAHGKELPQELELMLYEINAGRSTQATLLGQDKETVESLYISRALQNRLQRTALPA